MKHRILALFLAVSLLFCTVPTAMAADFTPQQQYNILRKLEDMLIRDALEGSSDDDPLGRALLEQLEADPTLFDRLMSTMLSDYDPYTMYVPAGSYSAAFDPETSYVGVGVTIQAHPRGALVTEVNLTGSAAKAGVQMGDILTGAAGKSLAGLDTAAISDLLRGKEGTCVEVTVLRGSETLTFVLERTPLTQLNYSGAPVADGVFYMKWSRITDDGSYMLFRMSLAQMVRDGYQSLILDLRDNPGGNLDLAFSIASDLMPEAGSFFRTAYRDPDNNDELTYRYIIADGKGADIPNIFILVNGNSASAAEIITAALRDKVGATVIGETTYGKGRGQQHYVLKNDAAIVLTTMMLLPLEGEDYDGVGLPPDVEVHNTTLKGEDAIVVPTDTALAPYSCSDNGEALNRALVSLGLLEQLPEKPYRVGEDTLDALNRLQAAYQLNDPTPGAGIPTLMLVNRLLDQQLQGRYLEDVQLSTAIQMAKDALNVQ